jgi:hypothetical protein
VNARDALRLPRIDAQRLRSGPDGREGLVCTVVVLAVFVCDDGAISGRGPKLILFRVSCLDESGMTAHEDTP